MRWLIALAALVANAAQAADIKVLTPERGNYPAVVTIHGLLNAGDDSVFLTVTSGVTRAVVYLESRGGNTVTAINIGWNIRKRQFQTAVTDNGACSSACALIWLAGTARYLGRFSRIGFHSSGVPGEDGKGIKRSEFGNIMIAHYLDYLGYSRGAIDYVTQADPKYVTWLTPFNATKYKIFPRPLTELNSRQQTR